MNIEQLKNEIKEKVDQIEKLNLSKLYPTGTNVGIWDSLSTSETQKFVQEIISALNELTDNLDLLDFVGFSNTHNINNHLANFITQYESIKDIPKDEMTTQHHSPLNQLNGLNNILRNTGLYVEMKLVPKLKEKLKTLKEVTPLSNKLLSKTTNLKNAIEQAEVWLETKGRVDEETIKGQATAYQDRAKEHKISGTKKEIKFFKWKLRLKTIKNYWLLSALAFSGVVGYFTYIFIQESGDDISMGKTLLKISSLIIPAYLTIFSTNQYLYHKKMYESYMFKYASLHTMNHLMSTHAKELQEKILEKGLNVLFSEPKTKEDGARYNKQLVSELIDMLKSQLK